MTNVIPRNIIRMPIKFSNTLQVFGFSKYLVNLDAPNPKLKKKTNDAEMAPSAKVAVFSNCVEIEPSITTVSRYT